jgi:putative ABC transport system permease protein
MFNNYLKLALRTLWRQRFYTSLNIFGLSLGIAVGLILFQFIRYHLSFDSYHQHASQLYRVVTELHLDDGTIEYSQGTPLALNKALQDAAPQVRDASVLLRVRSATIGVPQNGQSNYFTERNNIAFADPHWFDLFDHTWISGNAATALTAPNNAVISRRLAEKYFGKEDAIGKVLRFDSKYAVTVTGVLKDPPANTSFNIDLYLSRPSFKYFYPEREKEMNDYWGAIYSTTHSFIRLPDAAQVKNVEAAMATLVKKNFPADVARAYVFRLQPLKDLHFDGRYGGAIRRSLLLTLAIAGFFLVLIACFNFINLATAQSMKRAKEIGTRKVLGGTPASIFRQFITEISSIVILAAALSFLWCLLLLPVINSWLQSSLHLNPFRDMGLLAGIALLLVFVILASGLYPAFILSRFKPLAALKKQRTGTGAAIYRKGLVITQNVIVQGLIICSLIIMLQVRHLKTADLGFNKEAVLMVLIPEQDKHKMSYLRQELQTKPGIGAVSFCFEAPSSATDIGGSIRYDERSWEQFPSRTVVGDAQYLSTFKLALLAGENLRDSDTVRQALINQTLLHKLGFKDPRQVIGHQLVIGNLNDRKATIAGVVKDFNVHSLYKPMEPVIITTSQDMYRYAAIKLSGKEQDKARELIRKTWQGLYPENVFEYNYLDEQIDEFYHKEDLLSKLIKSTTVIAIVISCLGLLGLISFFTIQRTREIGIRKVLGASVTDIVYMLSKDFLVLIMLSVLIAAPLVAWFMDRWLQGFAYRINISWWMFFLSGLLLIIITLFTVGFQALKAAVANPVKSLQAE